MAVTTYIASSAGTTTPALPAGTVSGDIVVAFAYSSSGTAPTLPASWTNINSNAATPASRTQYRVYDGVWTMPTFTNAAQTHVLTIRGQDTISPIGVTSITNGNSSNPSFPAVTLVDTDGSSQLIRGINHTRPDSVITAPSGHTSRQASGTQPGWMTCTKNSTADGAAGSMSISRGTTWTQAQVEIKCVSSGVTQNAAVAMTATSTLTVGATTLTPVQAAVAMTATSTMTVTATAASDSLDVDTKAYLVSTGLDYSYSTALDGLVVGLKNSGLWSKMQAVYPMIGGTADLHKWNLKDPQDLDTSYRLTYYNAPSTTHSTALGYRANAQGQQANGGYADTHFVPLGVLAQDSTHLSWYGTEDTPAADRAEFGAFNWGGMATSRFHIIARYQGVNAYYYGQSENASTNVPSPAASGLFVTSRTGPTTTTPYRNGVKLGSSNQPSVTLPDRPLWLGGINSFVNRTDIPCGFASIGSGLIDADVTDLWTIVETYQTALGRNTTVVGGVTQNASADFVATSTMTVGGVREPQAAVSMTATSTLTTTAVRQSNATVAMTAISTMTVGAVRAPQAAVAMTTVSSMSAAATVQGQTQSAVAMVASSTMTVAVSRTVNPSVTFTSTSTLTVGAVRERVGAVAMVATATMSVTAVRSSVSAVAMTATSTLTVGVVRATVGSVAMVAVSTMTVTGTTAARQLGVIPNAAHTGFLWAMDVDRSWNPVSWPIIPFKPTDLTGVVSWLDANDYQPGLWSNKIAGGPATTVVGTPVMALSNTTQNGRPVVRFKTSEGRVRSAWPYPVDDWTLLYVMRWVGPGVGRAWTVCYPPSNLLVGTHTTGQDTFYPTWLGPNGGGASPWGTAPGPWKLYEADSSSSVGTMGFYINGTAYGRVATGSAQGLTNGWGLSGYDPLTTQETLDIEVAELIIYNRRLTTPERQQVETYLRDKWALT